MAIAIRDADLERDGDEIIQILRENISQQSDRTRFDWLYLQNPCGQARAWIAHDGMTGRTVGMAAAFPRPLWIDGEQRRAWVLGDFCIEPENRSLGPAVLLQRACLSSLAHDGSPVCYDFPSRTMMAVYRRLGIPAVGNQVRYVKLNRIDSKVHESISSPLLAKGISAIGNLALWLRDMPHSLPRGIEVVVQEGIFGEEFTAFDSSRANIHPIRGSRTAEYLNWRYRKNPLNQYRVVTARDGSRLLGYAIVEVSGRDWAVADLQVIEEKRTVPALLSLLHRLSRIANVDRLNAAMMEDATLVKFLRHAGFYARESLPVVACAHSGESFGVVRNSKSWFLMHGDRES